MEFFVLCAIVASLGIILLLIYKHFTSKNVPSTEANTNNNQQTEQAQGLRRRGLGRMNARNRNVENDTAQSRQEVRESPEKDDENDEEGTKKKIGKKKMAKLQLKEEKKQARESMEQMRDEKRKKEEQQLEDQKKKEKEKEEEEKKQELEEEKQRLIKEKKEEEEYQQWRTTMQVEQVGSLEEEKTQRESRIDEFIALVKEKKSFAIRRLGC